MVLSFLFLQGCNTQREKESQEKQTVENANSMKEERERTGEEISIVAVMKVKPEAIEKIKPIFQAIVQGSQEEEGCISYNLHHDINDPTTFVMLEEWQSQEAINFHNATEHYKSFKQASRELIEKSDVTLLKLVY